MKSSVEHCDLKQNAELTFKFNQDFGRHGWLRLTPAYSVKLVNDILKNQPVGISILDPFSGTGTTALCAIYQNCEATGIEINPFLCWLGEVKTAQYLPTTIERASECVCE